MTCLRNSCDKPQHTRGYCESHYRHRLHTGRYGYVDATAAREHVGRLRSMGWTYEQISTASGVAAWTPHQLVHGLRRTLRETSDALLSVEAVPVPSHRGVGGTGTYRRVEGLQWLGWPMHVIAERVGLKPYTLTTLRSRREPVSHRVALAVAELYDELGSTPGPSKQAATKAKRRGYVSPMAWEDIDDPAEEPTGVDTGIRRSLPAAEELRFLQSFGESRAAIASRFDVTENRIRQLLKEAA